MGAELHGSHSILSDQYNTHVQLLLPSGIRANACDLLLEYRLCAWYTACWC
jgi:hypothetical protein